MQQKLFAKIPAVDSVLQSEKLKTEFAEIDPSFLAYCVRTVLESLRQEIGKKPGEYDGVDREQFLQKSVEMSREKINSLLGFSLRRIVNATGVILHTGLGRAPLAESAQKNVSEVIKNYANVELNLADGKRGERQNHVEELLCYLTEAQAAAVVNNNAGAVLLALNTLAKGKEVIISRGQLIEIGGSFRLPDVMAQSGAIMKEVGTTNKTHLRDYENAVTENTGAILVAHSSNYRIMGFTKEAAIADLVGLSRKYNIPLIYDLGGGVFLDLAGFGLPHEPVVAENVKLGVDVVTFSGDKVLGGPQSGILVGEKAAITAIRKNALMRALRCDKLIYAALEATLKLYLQPERRTRELPAFRMLLETIEQQRDRARRLLSIVKTKVAGIMSLKMEEGSSQIGSGALPLAEIPSIVLRIDSAKYTAMEIAGQFRQGGEAVVGTIRDDGFYLNFRTIRDDEIDIIAEKIIGLKNV